MYGVTPNPHARRHLVFVLVKVGSVCNQNDIMLESQAAIPEIWLGRLLNRNSTLFLTFIFVRHYLGSEECV